jgi:hypothetical protein
MNTIRANSFDDDLLEKSFISLKQVWLKSSMARRFIQVEFGQIASMLACLRNNGDENCMEAAMEAFKALIVG